jgi:hypothetical protein
MHPGVEGTDREIPMRRLLPLALIGLGLVIQTLPSAAQSPYDYAWCALRGDRSGAQSCYYTSYRQCMASLRGIGGSCIPNPYKTPGRRYDRGPYRY